MVPLSRRHVQFLLLEEGLGSVVVNLLVNGAIAYLGTRNLATVPLWGAVSIAADTIGTAFVLPVLTALFAEFLVSAQVTRGLLPPLAPVPGRARSFAERSWFERGAALGVGSIVAVGAPVVGAFALFGPPGLSPPAFVVFKAAFAAALGAFVTPLLGWWALERASSVVAHPQR